MRRLIPDTIATRTLLVLIIGLTVSHFLSMGLYFADRATALDFTGGEHIGERIVTIDRLVRNLPPDERARVVSLADDPRLHVTLSRNSAIRDEKDGGWQAEVLRKALIAHLNSGGNRIFRLRYATIADPRLWKSHMQSIHPEAGAGVALLVSLPLDDGSWLNFAAPVEPPESIWSLRFILSMAVMLVAIGALSAIVVHHLTRPLAVFAKATQRLGVDVGAPPMPVRGPAEVRQAAKAFNEMQKRIRRFVEDRTQMIAAISHDLGTPITRLRLRAEFVEDEEQQKKMLADLQDMERMVSSVLSFGREEAESEPRSMVDLRTLLQRICDNAADAGHDVTLDVGDDAVPFDCRPAALRRAIMNLVENAARYGKRAAVTLDRRPDRIVIRIDDEGPGIPDDLQEEMFRPFRRLEASRSRTTGGTGLGLTISRSIVRAHGGDVTMQNRAEGGLRVEAYLPRLAI